MDVDIDRPREHVQAIRGQLLGAAGELGRKRRDEPNGNADVESGRSVGEHDGPAADDEVERAHGAIGPAHRCMGTGVRIPRRYISR